jgi:hypothetical protein
MPALYGLFFVRLVLLDHDEAFFYFHVAFVDVDPLIWQAQLLVQLVTIPSRIASISDSVFAAAIRTRTPASQSPAPSLRSATLWETPLTPFVHTCMLLLMFSKITRRVTQ